jgi:hypothetical protein
MSFASFIEGVLSGFLKLKTLEVAAKRKTRIMKRKLKRMATAVILGGVGGLLLLAGIIVFLTRFFAAEWILLGSGVLLLYAAFLVKISA